MLAGTQFANSMLAMLCTVQPYYWLLSFCLAHARVQQTSVGHRHQALHHHHRDFIHFYIWSKTFCFWAKAPGIWVAASILILIKFSSAQVFRTAFFLLLVIIYEHFSRFWKKFSFLSSFINILAGFETLLLPCEMGPTQQCTYICIRLICQHHPWKISSTEI